MSYLNIFSIWLRESRYSTQIFWCWFQITPNNVEWKATQRSYRQNTFLSKSRDQCAANRHSNLIGLASGHLRPLVSGDGLGFWDYGFKFNSNKIKKWVSRVSLRPNWAGAIWILVEFWKIIILHFTRFALFRKLKDLGLFRPQMESAFLWDRLRGWCLWRNLIHTNQ